MVHYPIDLINQLLGQSPCSYVGYRPRIDTMNQLSNVCGRWKLTTKTGGYTSSPGKIYSELASTVQEEYKAIAHRLVVMFLTSRTSQRTHYGSQTPDHHNILSSADFVSCDNHKDTK